MPERPPKSVEELADHINELDSLIGARKAPRPAAGAQVPILDDVVAPVSGPAGADTGRDPAVFENRLLQRLDRELAELATVIREIVRRCIREELGPGASDRGSGTDRTGGS